MSVVGIDLDGCLADFTTAYAELLIFVSGRDLLPPGWRTDPRFPSTWFWERAAGYTPEEESEVWQEHILKPGTFWQSLDLLPDAKSAIKQLNRLSMQGHDIYFLTHRMGKHAKLQTERWLYEHGMSYPTVLLTGDKAPVIASLKLDFYIDDKPDNLIEASRVMSSGLYVMDAPYNWQEVPPDLPRVKSVKDALITAGLWT